MPGIEGKQPTEFQEEVGRAFYRFYLNVGIGPRTPRLSHVFVFGTPFNPNSKRSLFTLPRFYSEPLIVFGGVVCLTVTGQMLYPQFINGNLVLRQTL